MTLTLLCATATLLLVWGEYTRSRDLCISAKVIASAAFVGVGLSHFFPSPFPAWVLAGLVLGAVGDIALLGRSSRAFLAGLLAFLGGHVAYIVAVAQLVAPRQWWPVAAPYAVVPACAGILALNWMWPKLGSMRGPVVAYVLTIVTMMVAALAAFRAHALPEPQRTRLVVGAALFFASDFAVARDRFVARGFVNKAWGLPAYYAGQLLIAWAMV